MASSAACATVVAIALCVFPTFARADLANLEPGLPTEIEDAEPAERGTSELQLPMRLENLRGSGSRSTVEPRLQRVSEKAGRRRSACRR